MNISCKKMAFAGALVGALLMPASGAFGGIISFDDDNTLSGGTISYNGVDGVGTLNGTNILFHSVVGVGTPLNDGNTLTCTGCVMNFTSGANNNENPWSFAAGGSIQITGTLNDPNNGNALVASGVLASGSFVNNFTTTVTGFGTILNFSAIGIDTKHPDLVAFYGENNPFEFSATTIQLGTATINPDGSFTATVTNADFDNQGSPPQNVVPEPGTMLLLGSGLVGLGLWRKFKK